MTVVSRDTFVNARPVARNVVSVPSKELAAAPVSRTVNAEPVRASMMGTGRTAAIRPPAAVMSRPVVALRTPAPMPRSLDQRQAKRGDELRTSLRSSVRKRQAGQSQPLHRRGRRGRRRRTISRDSVHSVRAVKATPGQSRSRECGNSKGLRNRKRARSLKPRSRLAMSMCSLRRDGRIRWPSRYSRYRRKIQRKSSNERRNSAPGSNRSLHLPRRNGSRIRIRRRRVTQVVPRRNDIDAGQPPAV